MVNMKYKISIILLIIITIPICICYNNLYNDTKVVVHQHLEYPKETKCDSDSFCTHLPIISIDTYNQEIPGSLTDNNTISSNIKLYFDENGQTNLESKELFSEEALINYRGHTSLSFDKKGIKIEFINSKKEDKKVEILDMEKSSEWVLHGPFIDKTLLRNYMWYNISHEMMGSAPNIRFCELFVNNEYKGVYLLVEAVTRGEHSRIKIDKYKKNSSTSSYILKLDRGSLNDYKNIKTFSNYSLKHYQVLNIEYPGVKNLSSDLRDYIIDDFSKFEKSLYSYDYDSKKYGYEEFIDVYSFVDYFIINEFTQNYDAGYLSTIIYKNNGGKFKMYVWDFNSANNNYKIDLMEEQNFRFQHAPWFYMLLKDEEFTDKIIKRYKYLRKNVLSDEYLLKYIDETKNYLGSSIDRNYDVWGYTFDEKNGYLYPLDRNPKNYDEAINSYKDAILKRAKWMDENIETIKQFSHDSKVKKFNH